MSAVETLLNRAFPVNYFVRVPEKGAPLLAGVTLLFTLIYRPLETSAGAYFSFEVTMFLYGLVVGFAAYASFRLIHLLRGEDASEPWTIQSEVISIVFSLVNMGTAVFLAAFLLEESADRWNWSTFSNSLQTTALIAGIPLFAATLLNIRSLFQQEEVFTLNEQPIPETSVITIQTQLREETIEFSPMQFIYAESDGNYIQLYLDERKHPQRVSAASPDMHSTEEGAALLNASGSGVRRHTIRLSMGSLEEQLKPYSIFMRTHRAFIVNLKKVREANGNTLGLELKLVGTDAEVPVSRSQVKPFKARFRAS
ncbi:MAG: LytTR family transcriptional regulator [Bacteroidetes bacterium]|nr:LytTR family transcriptional regulator [Bacteroidota bacterium]MCH8523145.1 LytTR family transcriptional regulator [Balneolales bacterium]